MHEQKAIGPDGLPAELLRILVDEGEHLTLGKTMTSSSCGECVEGTWRAAPME